METETTADTENSARQIEYAAVVDALDVSVRQFADLLDGLDEPDGERPVPGLRWSVGETAAHMLTILRRGTGDDRRADTIPGLAELNEQALAEVDTRSPAQLAELVRTEGETLVAILGGLSQDQAAGVEVQLHAGLRADLPSALSYILCDLLAHGHDISAAVNLRWDINPTHAALDLHAMVPLLEPWLVETVREGPRKRLAISFPGDDVAIVVETGEGRYRAHNADSADADGVSEVDPIETFLALSGRRESPHTAVRLLASWFQPF
jgi:uncharacterized protein (TIGR03083 family)